MSSVICCVDVIALYGGELVLIERLTDPKGLALPGGKRESGEFVPDCAVREFKEETGLELEISGTLGVYAEPGRDPRGNYVTTVVVGTATGWPKGENKKTKVVLLPLIAAELASQNMINDHGKILTDWLKTR